MIVHESYPGFFQVIDGVGVPDGPEPLPDHKSEPTPEPMPVSDPTREPIVS
jgi:hypothetical protein